MLQGPFMYSPTRNGKAHSDFYFCCFVVLQVACVIILFKHLSSYLFNCGEGTQRIAHEQKTRLAKVENIFFTRTSWANVGGLPGASLTIQDIGIPELKLHGPRGLVCIQNLPCQFF